MPTRYNGYHRSTKHPGTREIPRVFTVVTIPNTPLGRLIAGEELYELELKFSRNITEYAKMYETGMIDWWKREDSEKKETERGEEGLGELPERSQSSSCVDHPMTHAVLLAIL